MGKRIVKFPADFLQGLITQDNIWSAPAFTNKVMEGIPKDAKFVTARFDAPSATFILTFEHPTWQDDQDTPLYQIEEINPIMRTSATNR